MALGHRKPWLNTSSESPRTFTTSLPETVTSRPHVASQKGQVRKCVVSLAATPLSLPLAQLDPDRARAREHRARRVEEHARGLALAPLAPELPRDQRVGLADPHG